MSYTGVVGAKVNVLFPSLARAKSEAFNDPGKQRRFRWEEWHDGMSEGRGVGRSVTRTEWGGPHVETSSSDTTGIECPH